LAEEEKKNIMNINLKDPEINFDLKETVNTDNNQFYKEDDSFDENTKSKGPNNKRRILKIEKDVLANKQNMGGNIYFNISFYYFIILKHYYNN